MVSRNYYHKLNYDAETHRLLFKTGLAAWIETQIKGDKKINQELEKNNTVYFTIDNKQPLVSKLDIETGQEKTLKNGSFKTYMPDMKVEVKKEGNITKIEILPETKTRLQAIERGETTPQENTGIYRQQREQQANKVTKTSIKDKIKNYSKEKLSTKKIPQYFDGIRVCLKGNIIHDLRQIGETEKEVNFSVYKKDPQGKTYPRSIGKVTVEYSSGKHSERTPLIKYSFNNTYNAERYGAESIITTSHYLIEQRGFKQALVQVKENQLDIPSKQLGLTFGITTGQTNEKVEGYYINEDIQFQLENGIDPHHGFNHKQYKQALEIDHLKGHLQQQNQTIKRISKKLDSIGQKQQQQPKTNPNQNQQLKQGKILNMPQQKRQHTR